MYANLITSMPMYVCAFWSVLLPAATVGLPYQLMSPAETATFIDNYLYRNQISGLTGLSWWQAIVHHTGKVVFALQILPILVLGFRKISFYNMTGRHRFTDFINRQRIDHACELIQQPQLPINELACKSGFSSVSSFYRNFKIYKGCSPKDYPPAT